jgi:hypothetical protein
MRGASGPYWLSGNLDPTYTYLMNSLNVATMHRPYYTDHPGTPVDLVGAVVIRAINPGSDRATIASSVLSDPEKYIAAINLVLVIICAVSLFVAGYVAQAVFKGLFPPLLIQASPFVSSTTLYGLRLIWPELLMIPLSVVLVAVVLWMLRPKAPEPSLRYSILLGLIVGFGVAAKVDYVPVALLAVVVLPSWRQRIIFSVTTGLAFTLAIVPILTPALLRQMLGFLFNTATHTGMYGSGAPGFIEPHRYLASAVELVKGDALFFTIVLISMAALALKSRLPALSGTRYRALLGVTAAQVLQLLMVAKHPSSRFLIPSLALVGLNLALLAEVFGGTLRARYRHAAALAACLIIVVVQAWAIRNLFRGLRDNVQFQSEAYATASRRFASVPMVSYYVTSSPYYALSVGSGTSGNLFATTLEQLYPNHFFYNPWTGMFSTFAGPVELDEIAKAGDWFILRGCSWDDPTFKGFLPPNALPDRLAIERIPGERVNPGPMDCDAVYKATVRPGS